MKAEMTFGLTDGRPDIMPNFPDEEPEGWTVTVRFPVEEVERCTQGLVKAIGNHKLPVFVKRRSLGARFFSWPWRPWHNVKVWGSSGRIAMFEKDVDDERVKFTAHGEGKLDVRTARR